MKTKLGSNIHLLEQKIATNVFIPDPVVEGEETQYKQVSKKPAKPFTNLWQLCVSRCDGLGI